MPEEQAPKSAAAGVRSGEGGAMAFGVSVGRLPKAGMALTFEAHADERAALANQLMIPSVERLTAKVLVAPWRADGVRITGNLSAVVVQESVVTLEPLRRRVEEEVDLVFVPEGSKIARMEPLRDGELHLDPEGPDLPETFSGDRIDLGAVLTEILALGLDPYPREASASFGSYDTDPAPAAAAPSPFAGLSKLKPREE